MNSYLKTVSFYGTCLANSELTLISQRISTPYAVKNILAHFALNCARTLQLDFYISQDTDVPTIGRPGGFSLLGEYGQVNYVVGDDETKNLENHASSPTSPSWIKVYANNTDGFNHTVDVQIIIEIQPRE